MNFASIKFDLLLWFIATVRMASCFAIFPAFQKSWLPGILRHGLVASLSLIFVPVIGGELSHLPENALAWLLFLCKEVLIGMALGIVAAIPLWIAEAFGSLIDTQSGGSSSSMFNPASANEATVLSSFIFQAFMLYFISIGGLGWIFLLVAESYSVWPPSAAWPRLQADAVHWWQDQFAQLLSMTVLLAAPAAIVMFLIELTLGVAGRFAPQLQVFFIAMPLKSVAAVGTLSIYLGLAFSRLTDGLPPAAMLVRSLGEIWHE